VIPGLDGPAADRLLSGEVLPPEGQEMDIDEGTLHSFMGVLKSLGELFGIELDISGLEKVLGSEAGSFLAGYIARAAPYLGSAFVALELLRVVKKAKGNKPPAEVKPDGGPGQ
jgi:hypothetical protein